MSTRKHGNVRWMAAAVGAALLAVGAAAPAHARRTVVFTPYGPVAVPQRRAAGFRNPYAQRGLRRPAVPRANNRRRPTVNVKSDGKRATIDLTSEIQALKGRHDSLVAKLPPDLRRLDPRVMATMDRLPPLAQFSYMTTVEDYPTLLANDQAQFRTLMIGIADLSDKDRDRFVEGAGKSFGALEADAAQMKSARNQPHATCFKLNADLEALKNPPAANQAEPGTAPDTPSAATPAPAAKRKNPARKNIPAE